MHCVKRHVGDARPFDVRKLDMKWRWDTKHCDLLLVNADPRHERSFTFSIALKLYSC